MKKLLYIAVIISMSVLISCGDDFLNQPPRGSLTAGNFPSSASDAELALNACYNSLREWQLASGGFPLFDMMSDEATKGSNPGDGAAISVYDNFSHTSEEGSAERYYKTLYQSVRRANLVLTKVPDIDMNSDRQNEILAEARFLRAYYYGLLIRSFGAVPMVTEVDPPLDLMRTDPSIIMSDIIVPDLEFGISVLVEKSQQATSERTRATKGAARGLLARLYMYYNNTVEAEKLLLDIIESGEYDLADSFDQVFVEENEHGIESLFEVSALPFSFALGGSQYANTMGIRGTPNRGWGFGRPAYTWISKMQDSEDPRLDPTVIFLGEVLGGVETDGDSSTPDTTYVDGQIVEIECYNQKIWHSGTNTETSFGHNRRIIRYSDILLLAAEALTRNDKATDALVHLNRVRERARNGNSDILPDITTTNTDELLDIIMEERNRELALEGQRFWDLVRTNRAEEVLGPLGFLPNKNELLPIPQSEIDISEGRITQNMGY